MAKTKAQVERTEQVRQRLTSEGPVRLDFASVKSGRSKAAKEAGYESTGIEVHEIHPSLESATRRIDEESVRAGTITTPSGLSVRVSRKQGEKDFGPVGQGLGPQQGKTPLPPVQEGMSQKFRQRIGREHGPEVAARLTAEAKAIAARPNPLASDGMVNLIATMHTPSMGGNRAPGGLSALARDAGERSQIPADKRWSKATHGPLPKELKGVRALFRGGPAFDSGRDLALHSLGYTDEVQQRLFDATRERIRASSSPTAPALSEAEVYARAHGQLQEHLDEALHGSRDVGKESRETDVITSGGTAAQAISGLGRSEPNTLGMTPGRSPEQVAMRKTARDLVRAGGKGGKAGPWAANLNKPGGEVTRTEQQPVIDELTGEQAINEKGKPRVKTVKATRKLTAVDMALHNDLERLTKEQEARRALGKHPEEYNVFSPGAEVEQRGEVEAQPAISTGPSLAAGPRRPSQPVGVAVAARGKVLPPGQRVEGEISPLPPNLPTEPARLGRTRAERGLSDIRDSRKSMRGGLAPLPRDYGSAIARYEAGRSSVQPRSGRR